MKKFFFLMVLFFTGITWISADQQAEGDFIELLNQIKNPFVVELPKPVVLRLKAPVKSRIAIPEPPKLVVAKPQESIALPDLKLQGVIIGDNINQVIIDNQIVGLQEMIKGARIIEVSQEGVTLLFKGKKFFLKTDSNGLLKSYA